MVAIRKDKPSPEIRNLHLGVINANFDLLATEAYRGWITTGKRGLLVIDESTFLGKPPGIQVEFCMKYIMEGTNDFLHVAGPHELLWFKTGKKGKLYNPEEAFCVTFLRGDEGISSYCILGFWERTPKALYERSVKKP